VLVLSVAGAAVLFIRRDSTDRGRDPGGVTASSDVNAAPLTIKELFPQDPFTDAADRTYAVLGTDATNDCSSAARDKVVTLLEEAGCSQVVRASLRSPNGRLVLTAGVFNLSDDTAAQRLMEQAVPALESGDGGLTGMQVDGAPEVPDYGSSGAQSSPHGPFLPFCFGVDVPDPPEGDGESAAELCGSVLERLGGILAARR
jgi:hypothetical protein